MGRGAPFSDRRWSACLPLREPWLERYSIRASGVEVRGQKIGRRHSLDTEEIPQRSAKAPSPFDYLPSKSRHSPHSFLPSHPTHHSTLFTYSRQTSLLVDNSILQGVPAGMKVIGQTDRRLAIFPTLALPQAFARHHDGHGGFGDEVVGEGA